MAQGTTISKSLFSIFITGGKMTTLGKPKSELAGANLSDKGATAPPPPRRKRIREKGKTIYRLLMLKNISRKLVEERS